MQKVAIVTDSTTDIPAALAEELNILVAPIRIAVKGREYRDKIDISREEFFDFYDRHIEASKGRRRSQGGSFWNNQRVRIGDLFGSAVAQAVWAGRLLYRDAYELTGLRGKTFDNYVAGLGL